MSNQSVVDVTTRVRDLLEELMGPVAKWPSDWQDTPSRVARFLVERFDPPTEPKMTVFAGSYKDMVIERDIPITGYCPHHLMPYTGVAHVAYVPSGNVVGLSKIPRLVEWCATFPRMQEELTQMVADKLMNNPSLKPAGVFVSVSAVHSCMALRGVRSHGVKTITTAIRGSVDKAEVQNSLSQHEGN